MPAKALILALALFILGLLSLLFTPPASAVNWNSDPASTDPATVQFWNECQDIQPASNGYDGWVSWIALDTPTPYCITAHFTADEITPDSLTIRFYRGDNLDTNYIFAMFASNRGE